MSKNKKVGPKSRLFSHEAVVHYTAQLDFRAIPA